MDVNTDQINTLLQNLEQYHKTNLELLKLKAIDKTADVISTWVPRTFFVITCSIILVTLTITAALWLGELLGKTYYGFLVISLVYAVAAAVLFFTHNRIKNRIADSVVTEILN
jgi:hypothetical protein